MRLDDLVDDTVALAEALCRDVDRPQIHLLAHSGGTVPGILAVARAPELFESYTAVAQITHQLASEVEARGFLIAEARRRGETRLARRLERCGVIEGRGTSGAWLRRRDTAMHRLGGGTTRSMRSVITGILLPSLRCRDHTPAERVRFWVARARSGASPVWDEILATDLRQVVPRLHVQVRFLHGVHDRTCSYALGRGYLDALEAPQKGFYSFRDSAHSPHFEEPERVRRIMAHDVLGGHVHLAGPPGAGAGPLPTMRKTAPAHRVARAKNTSQTTVSSR